MNAVIRTRQADPEAEQALLAAGTPPLLARLFAARNVRSPAELHNHLASLLPYQSLKNIDAAAERLARAIREQERILIVADYDADGATACAVGILGLRRMGARGEFLVPDRFKHGYGLTPQLANLAAERGTQLLLTVDNGISSTAGVARAQALGMDVIITDHHLPDDTLPECIIVNPNQPGCAFASKNLAGVGVIFYVLTALRALLRTQQWFNPQRLPEPNLAELLDLVALGTVADVVRLDENNRRLVAQGLRRIRAGHMQPGLAALFEASGRPWAKASAADFGFALGPRINAAGRLADMTIGIELLLTDDAARARELAARLDAINRQRREIENGMREQALLHVENLFDGEAALPVALSVHDDSFHEGVVGIVASRLKDKWRRPAFVFAASGAPGKEGELKGSGRSIPGFHLRDALDLVAKRSPGTLLKFGGHTMAAGCTIARGQFDAFRRAFEQVAAEELDAAALSCCMETDGPLPAQYRCPDVAEALQAEVWGQGFPAPLFCDEVQVISQRLVGGEKHLSLKLRHAGETVDAIWFNHTGPLPERPRLAYRLDVDEWQGQRRVRFIVEAAEGESLE